MKSKYAMIFKVFDDSHHVRIYEDIEKMVSTTKSTRRKPDAPRITATITITKANIKTVQSFLWKLTEKAMKEDFEFYELATSTKSIGNIEVNEVDAHLSIVKQSLNLLLANPEEKTKPLASYLLRYLPKHLKHLRDATELSEMERDDMEEIGRGIFALFSDGEIFEKHWNSCQPCLRDWLWKHAESGDGVQVFWKWLNDPETIRGLGKRDRIWLNEQKSTLNPGRSLLQPVALMVSNNWLQGRSWDVRGTFRWIRDFLSIVCYHGESIQTGKR